MSLTYIEYLIPAILFIIILSVFLTRVELRFYDWVEDYWFFKRSFLSRVASAFFIFGLSFLVFALLDLRGPEENIEATISKEKTLILIDSSASMLSEDVRPNRFQKALVLAKHYVKKAVGQHISVVVFSDSQKKIIPFTNDVDLIEARLSSLENIDLTRGGTGLKLAIQEAIQHFKVEDKSGKGNILIFTDAENNESFGEVNIKGDINVAVVGVGTAKGGKIPLRDKRGVFKGNKKFRGEEVVTKLNESFLVELGKKIDNYNYWVASSYSLPTNEILNFFNEKMDEQEQAGNIRIRPVLSHYLMVPGIIFLILSLILKNFKSFVLPVFLLFSVTTFAQEEEKKETPKTEDAIYLENKLKDGNISFEEKRKLANELLKTKHTKESVGLYKEIIKDKINEENKNDYFNLGLGQLLNKESGKGLKTYKELYDYLKKTGDKDLLQKTKLNMLKALKMQQQQKQQQKKQDQQKKDQEKNKNKDKNKDNKQKGDKKNQKKNEKSQGGKGEDQEKKDENKEDGKKDQNDKKDQKQDQKNDQQQKQKNDQDKQGKGKKMNKKKIPALLKQLMQDDNKLQKKLIDSATGEGKRRDKKDW